MARPRFHRLPSAQQNAILDAASVEFSAHGFADASLNRIIESAGISKGAMYYYFDGKDDLYADVLRRVLERLLEDSGGLPDPVADTADGFWTAVEDYYVRLVRVLATSPDASALLRDWLTGTSASALREGQREAERAIRPWLEQLVTTGQELGAVRADLPTDLLLAVAMGMGQAMDTWMISRSPATLDIDDAVPALIGMMRAALGRASSPSS